MTNDDGQSPWAEYDRLIGLHKFYFEYLIKAAGFSFGLVGAILAYVIDARLRESPHPWVGLALPMLISLGTCVVFGLGIGKTIDFAAQVREAQQRLKITWRPHAEILVGMSVIFTILFLVVSVGLAVAAANPQLLPEAKDRANPTTPTAQGAGVGTHVAEGLTP